MNRINQTRMLAMVVSIAALLLAVTNVQAKAPKGAKKPAVVKVEGTLSVKMNDKNKVEAIEITDGSGETYHIVANPKFKKKAKKLDGQQVIATGKMKEKMSKKKQQKWMTLKKLKAAPAAAK